MTLFDTLFRGLTGSEKTDRSAKPVKRALSDTASDRQPTARQTSPPPRRSEEMKKHEKHKPTPAESHSLLDEYVEGDIELPPIELPVILSPLRTVSGPHRSKIYETSLSTADTSAPLSTPGADISFGPQSLPFMLRKRLIPLDTDSPVKGPNNTPTSLYKQEREVGKATITIRHPDESLEEVEMIATHDGPVSEWRREQVKYMRKGRMSKNQELKRIPILHGPLSLPYARNPSGVDAALPDDASYLTHISWDPHPGLLPPAIIYEPGEYRTKHATDDADIIVHPKKHTDKVQAKSKAIEIKEAPTDREHKTKPLASSAAASSILRTSPSKYDEITLPRTYHIPIPPSTDPFDMLIDAAIASATQYDKLLPNHRAATAEPLRRRASALLHETIDGLPHRASYSDLLSLWNASNNMYGRLPDGSTPQQRTTSDKTSGDTTKFASAAYSTPIRISPPGNVLPSKADTSENWRQKFSETPGGTEIPRISGANDPYDGKDVMTIDAPFEKFNTSEDNKENTLPNGLHADPAIKETLVVAPSKSSNATSRSALTDARHVGSNILPKPNASGKSTKLRRKTRAAAKGVALKEKDVKAEQA